MGSVSSIHAAKQGMTAAYMAEFNSLIDSIKLGYLDHIVISVSDSGEIVMSSNMTLPDMNMILDVVKQQLLYQAGGFDEVEV